ncbi:MAG: C40 family peptidase [Aureispira sp.]
MKDTQKSLARTIGAYFFFLLGTQVALQSNCFAPQQLTLTPAPAAATTLMATRSVTAPLLPTEALPTSLSLVLLAEETTPHIEIEHRDITGLKREILGKRKRDARRAERTAAALLADNNEVESIDEEEIAIVELPVAYHAMFDSLNASGIRGNILQEAKKYLGLKYIWGGTTPRGFDCSGFTSYVLAQKGVGIARSSRYQAKQGKAVELTEAKTGDLIFFSKYGKGGRVTHVALVVDNKEDGVYIIHSTRRGIVVDNLSKSNYWKPKILYAKDVISKG